MSASARCVLMPSPRLAGTVKVLRSCVPDGPLTVRLDLKTTDRPKRPRKDEREMSSVKRLQKHNVRNY